MPSSARWTTRWVALSVPYGNVLAPNLSPRLRPPPCCRLIPITFEPARSFALGHSLIEASNCTHRTAFARPSWMLAVARPFLHSFFFLDKRRRGFFNRGKQKTEGSQLYVEVYTGPVYSRRVILHLARTSAPALETVRCLFISLACTRRSSRLIAKGFAPRVQSYRSSDKVLRVMLTSERE